VNGAAFLALKLMVSMEIAGFVGALAVMVHLHVGNINDIRFICPRLQFILVLPDFYMKLSPSCHFLSLA
jgi:hypothetical protein